MIDVTEALQDVSKAFVRPRDINAAEGLSFEQKAKLLHQWEYDVRSLMVAADENMSSDTDRTAQLLAEIHAALAELGHVPAQKAASAPTRPGNR